MGRKTTIRRWGSCRRRKKHSLRLRSAVSTFVAKDCETSGAYASSSRNSRRQGQNNWRKSTTVEDKSHTRELAREFAEAVDAAKEKLTFLCTDGWAGYALRNPAGDTEALLGSAGGGLLPVQGAT
jgi:hypothetical protein